MSAATFADSDACFSMVGRTVRSRCRISDNPASRTDDSVKRGAVGTVEDYDSCAGLFVVEFNGRGSILCAPGEIR